MKFKRLSARLLPGLKTKAVEYAGNLQFLFEITSYFTKSVAVITASCFLLTAVFAQPLGAIVDYSSAEESVSDVQNGYFVPSSCGRITEARYYGSKQSAVIVQDLHCHPEVQRNTAHILKLLHEHYAFSRVYVEGGIGEIDTSWVDLISDTALRERIVDALVDTGKLTGGEYFSIRSKKHRLLAGLEDEKNYRENIVRLQEILSKKNDIAKILLQVKSEVGTLEEKRYGQRIKKLKGIIGKYKNAKISPEKYYRTLVKLSKKEGINADRYTSIGDYLNLVASQRKLNYKKVEKELREYLAHLKETLPYSDYNALVRKANDFSRPDAIFYLHAALNGEHYQGKHGGKRRPPAEYKELNKYYAFEEANRNINPLKLVREEKELAREIVEKYARSKTESETAFIAEFFACLEEYFGARISAEDYAYLRANKEAFKSLCAQHLASSSIPALDPYYALYDKFYQVNIERNGSFARNIHNLGNRESSEAIVMITGGFHTPGLTELLREKGISYLVVTPNVTQDTRYSDSVYARLAKQQADTFSAQTIALQLYSQKMSGLLADEKMLNRAGLCREDITATYLESQLALYFRQNPRKPGENASQLNEICRSLGEQYGQDGSFEYIEEKEDGYWFKYVCKAKDGAGKAVAKTTYFVCDKNSGQAAIAPDYPRDTGGEREKPADATAIFSRKYWTVLAAGIIAGALHARAPQLPVAGGMDNDGSGRISAAVLERASKALSGQDANIVFEKYRNERWIFRRGPVDLEIDAQLCALLGERMTKRGRKAILIPLRNHDASSLQAVLNGMTAKNGDFKEQLLASGIKGVYDYKRILLVAPYGAAEEKALRYAVPHKGMETLAYRLLRQTDDTDAIVYNPNLTSPEALCQFVHENRFDAIGFSILSTVLKANLEIMGRLHLIAPDAIMIAGGMEMAQFPREQVFESWPVDIIAYDTGASLVNAMKKISRRSTKNENLESIRHIDDIAVALPGGEYVVNQRQSTDNGFPGDIYARPLNETPFEHPDLVHGRHYDTLENAGEIPVLFDRIGRYPVRIPFGDYCKGKCIFCGLPRNTRKNLSPQEVVEKIRFGFAAGDRDSIHFESADFLFRKQDLHPLLRTLTEDDAIRKIPKMAIARVDEVGDGAIMRELSGAGFKMIAFGIESFDDNVLQHIGKGVTAAANIRALQYALREGIKPGLNLMVFTPWDTVATTLKTIDHSLYFMEKGAYINVVPYITVGYRQPITNMKDIITYEVYDYPGLKKPFVFPRYARPQDPELLGISGKAIKKLWDLEESDQYPQWAQSSVTVYSLLIFKAFLMVLKEDNVKVPADIDLLAKRVEDAIGRVIRAEASTMREKHHPLAAGVTETWYNPSTGLLERVSLLTEDGKSIVLALASNDSRVSSGKISSGILTYEVLGAGKETEDVYGQLTLDIDGKGNIRSPALKFESIARADVFVHRAVSSFAERVKDNAGLLFRKEADYRNTNGEIIPQFHRLPSVPLFGEKEIRAVLNDINNSQFILQVRATLREGMVSLAQFLMQCIPFIGENIRDNGIRKQLQPAMAVSDLDLTRFPEDDMAKEVIGQAGADALKYKTASVSIYPRHIDHLPVEELKRKGVHVGVVAAFPEGLSPANSERELKALDEAVKKGADEVDLVMDVPAIIRGNIPAAERSLADFALGVEIIKKKYGKPVRIKTIIETGALKDEGRIRDACRVALKYSDMIKMVSGFPVKIDSGNRGRATLAAARVMLEEIRRYYAATGILRGMKITGGIAQWDDPGQPERSARRYYELVFDVLGRHLGYHYLFERDLFRIGGYDNLSSFLKEIKAEHVPFPSRTVAFDPKDYPHLEIPETDEKSSLKISEYLGVRVPGEIVEAIRSRQSSIEIHRGSGMASEAYLRNLVCRGYGVQELVPRNDKLFYKYYRVEKDGLKQYMVTSLLGEARELFMLQTLYKHYGCPSSLISIREFDEGGFTAILDRSLGRYGGRIAQTVFMHDVFGYAGIIEKELGMTIVDKIEGEYVKAAVLERKDGRLAMLFDMAYANGKHIEKVVNYCASPVASGGLGTKDITLFGACGGIGKDVALNDLVLYSDIYWDGRKLEGIPKNAVDAEALRNLLPYGVKAHTIPIYDIATVLNGSIDLSKRIYSSGGGAIELEAAHAAMAARNFPGVSFRAFYEVHDLPALSVREKNNSLGKNVPGYEAEQKMRATWIALATYLFAGEEQRIRKNEPDADSRRAGEGLSHAVATVERLLIKENRGNVIFLGLDDGLRYCQGIREQLKNKLLYRDAHDYLPALKKGSTLMELWGREIQTNASGEGILFINNIDAILSDRALRIQFHSLVESNRLPVIGYMPVKKYPQVESAYGEGWEENGVRFDSFNFELTKEDNPAIKRQRVVVLGATGLVGRHVMAELKNRGFENVRGMSMHGRPEQGIEAVDLTDRDALQELAEDADIIINSAVDLNFPGMEAGGDARDRAWAVNVGVPKIVKESGYRGKFVQLSSYYVFGHNDQTVWSGSEPGPMSVYGKHKLEAEHEVAGMDDYAIVRLGQLFGHDPYGRQKGFFSAIVKQLEDQREGKSVDPLETETTTVNPSMSLRQTAAGIVSIVENDFSGIAQLSGKESMNTIEKAEKIAGVYNSMFNTGLKLRIQAREKKGGLAPDVVMMSMITPDFDECARELIDDYRNDNARAAMEASEADTPLEDAPSASLGVTYRGYYRPTANDPAYNRKIAYTVYAPEGKVESRVYQESTDPAYADLQEYLSAQGISEEQVLATARQDKQSIVVALCAYNAEGKIVRSADGLFKEFREIRKAHPGWNLTLLYCPNGCTDNTLADMQQVQAQARWKEEKVEVLIADMPERVGKINAINIAREIARGMKATVFSCTDDDVSYFVGDPAERRPGSILSCIEQLRATPNIVFIGALSWPQDRQGITKSVFLSAKRYGNVHTDVNGVLMMSLMDAWPPIPSWIMSDDFYLNSFFIEPANPGKRIIVNPEAKVVFSAGDKFWNNWRRKIRSVLFEEQVIAFTPAWKRPAVRRLIRTNHSLNQVIRILRDKHLTAKDKVLESMYFMLMKIVRAEVRVEVVLTLWSRQLTNNPQKRMWFFSDQRGRIDLQVDERQLKTLTGTGVESTKSILSGA